MKGMGILVVSLRDVNFGFSSRLGCSWQNTIIFSRKGLFEGRTEEILKNYIFSIHPFHMRSPHPRPSGCLNQFSKFSASFLSKKCLDIKYFFGKYRS